MFETPDDPVSIETGFEVPQTLWLCDLHLWILEEQSGLDEMPFFVFIGDCE